MQKPVLIQCINFTMLQIMLDCGSIVDSLSIFEQKVKTLNLIMYHMHGKGSILLFNIDITLTLQLLHLYLAHHEFMTMMQYLHFQFLCLKMHVSERKTDDEKALLNCGAYCQVLKVLNPYSPENLSFLQDTFCCIQDKAVDFIRSIE